MNRQMCNFFEIALQSNWRINKYSKKSMPAKKASYLGLTGEFSVFLGVIIKGVSRTFCALQKFSVICKRGQHENFPFAFQKFPGTCKGG